MFVFVVVCVGMRDWIGVVSVVCCIVVVCCDACACVFGFVWFWCGVFGLVRFGFVCCVLGSFDCCGVYV